MSALSFLQRDFHAQCSRTNSAPNMEIWAPYIRRVSSAALYVIIHNFTIPKKIVEPTGPLYESGINCYLLTANQINWPNHRNDPAFRDKYFHRSSYDTNIWILMNDFRNDTEKITILVKK